MPIDNQFSNLSNRRSDFHLLVLEQNFIAFRKPRLLNLWAVCNMRTQEVF